MSGFALNPRLAADTFPVGLLDLCEVRAMNDRRFPWLILVPRRALLIEEIAETSEALKRLTGADKMNVAALGNEVRQLHIHVIARRIGDAAWPGPVWGKGVRDSYAQGDGAAFARAVAKALRLHPNANAL